MKAPIVTNADRDWALAQRPDWLPAHRDEIEAFQEIVDDGGWLDTESKPKAAGLSWANFVTGEIESFERFFTGQQKTYADWSYLWRNSWWPKRREEWSFKMAPRPLQPFFRQGTPEFAAALKLGTKLEKRMWTMFGVAQFRPDDPRIAKLKAVKDKRK